jgi:hypothetical protein
MKDLNELRTQLEEMSWADLKQTAKTYGYNYKREDKREDIIATVLKLAEDDSRIKAVMDLNSPPKPGFARIRIHTHDRAGGKDPVQLSVNGKEVTIARDAVVDVAHKFVDVLRNAVNDLMFKDGFNYSEDQAGTYEDYAEEERNFGFDLLASTPGQDPWPTALEKQLRNRYLKRRADAKQHGEEWLTDARWRLATGRPASAVA